MHLRVSLSHASEEFLTPSPSVDGDSDTPRVPRVVADVFWHKR